MPRRGDDMAIASTPLGEGGIQTDQYVSTVLVIHGQQHLSS